MKKIGMKRIGLMSTLLVFAALSALAGESAPIRVSSLKPEAVGGATLPASAAGSGYDEQLNLRAADFTAFAQAKIQEMNRNLLSSRERMQIRKEANGSYRATYHQIDDTSLACKVSRSRSRSIPYVAVLSYREQIYAASCVTPDQCAEQQFTPVDYIPNRHIFSYSNGTWN